MCDIERIPSLIVHSWLGKMESNLDFYPPVLVHCVTFTAALLSGHIRFGISSYHG